MPKLISSHTTSREDVPRKLRDEALRVYTVLESELKRIAEKSRVKQATNYYKLIRDLERIIADEMMCILYDPRDKKYLSVKEVNKLLDESCPMDKLVYSFAKRILDKQVYFTPVGSEDRTLALLTSSERNQQTEVEILSFEPLNHLRKVNSTIPECITSLLPMLTQLRILDIGMFFLRQFNDRQFNDYLSKIPGLFDALKEVKSLEGLSIREIDENEFENIPTILSVTSSHQHLRYILFSGWILETNAKFYKWDKLGALNESNLFSPSLRLIVFKSTTSHTISKSFIDDLALDKIKEPSEVLLIMNQWDRKSRFRTECYQMLNRISFQTFPKSLYTTHIMTKGDLPPLFSRNVQNLVLSNSRIENENDVGSEAEMKEVLSEYKNLKTLTIIDLVGEEDPTARKFEEVYPLRTCSKENDCKETEQFVVVKRHESRKVYMSSLLKASLSKPKST